MVRSSTVTYLGSGTPSVSSTLNFTSGVHYTTKELGDGYARMLMNFKQSADGSILTQRPGIATDVTIGSPHVPQFRVRFQSDGRELDFYTNTEGTQLFANLGGTNTGAGAFDQPSGLTVKLDSNGYMKWCKYPPNDSIIFLGSAGGNEGLFQVYYSKKESKLKCEYVTAYESDPARSATNGFNLYHPNPVNFSDDTSALSHGLTAIFGYRKDASKPRQLGNIIMEGTRGEEILFKVYHKRPSSGTTMVQWEYQAHGSETWDVRQKWTDISKNDADILPLTPNDDAFALRVKLAKSGSGEGGIEEATAKALVYPFFEITKSGKDFDVNFSTNLRKADNVLYYNRQLVVYGENTGEANSLFFSEFEDFSYFPYPNKSVNFDDKIIHVHQHQDDLVVFTQGGIYLLSDSIFPQEMKMYTLKTDLTITPEDAKTVKTMGKNLYFMVGYEHYLGVPQKLITSKDNLQIFKVSDNIEFLFQKNILENFIFSRLGEYTEIGLPSKSSIRLTNKFSYVDRDVVKVYLNYYCLWDDKQANYCLVVNYNNKLRSWTFEEIYNQQVQYLYREIITDDIRIATRKYQGVYTDEVFKDGDTPLKLFLDTGNRDMDPLRKKRFKSFSLHLNNHGSMELDFKFEFRLDGTPRQTFKQQKAVWYTDRSHPRYGEIDYMEVEEPNLEAPGVLEFPDGKLTFSHFEGVDRIKVNKRISGIGYLPDIILKAEATKPFELMGYSLLYKGKKAK